MKYFTFNLKEKEINMRLTSQDSIQIEKTYGVSLLDYVQSPAITNIVTLLKYMRRGAGENVTDNMAYSFYDELIDEGYTIEKILMELVYPTLVVSGVLSQEDFDNIKEEKEKVKNMTEEEKQELIEKRKNVQK